MDNLTEKDCDKYLASGFLTEPFLDDEYVLQKVLTDYSHKIKENNDYTEIESLYNWIHHCIKSTSDMDIKHKFKFQRTAKEIWESGFCTGCTDWATLFITFTRQIGIPTTMLHTAEKEWVEKLQKGEKQPVNFGHSFCECYYKNKWVLVDPTFRKLIPNYDSGKIILDYNVAGKNVFIPYFRGLDLEKKQTVKEHNDEMNRDCLKLKI